MNMGGMVRSIPISALCSIRYDYTYAGIKRKNNERIITLSSDVKEGFNPNEVAAKVQQQLSTYKHTDPVVVRFAGQAEDQKETSGFLGKAMLISIALMLIVLVGLFNSLGKPLIILSEILLRLS